MLPYIFLSEKCPRPLQDLLLLNCCVVDNQGGSWTEKRQSPQRTVVEHVLSMRERTEWVIPIVRENLVEAQYALQSVYDA